MQSCQKVKQTCSPRTSNNVFCKATVIKQHSTGTIRHLDKWNRIETQNKPIHLDINLSTKEEKSVFFSKWGSETLPRCITGRCHSHPCSYIHQDALTSPRMLKPLRVRTHLSGSGLPKAHYPTTDIWPPPPYQVPHFSLAPLPGGLFWPEL